MDIVVNITLLSNIITQNIPLITSTVPIFPRWVQNRRWNVQTVFVFVFYNLKCRTRNLVLDVFQCTGRGVTTAVIYGMVYGVVYVCMVITCNSVWINRVRLPILLVVSWTGKMNISLSLFAPEILVSRDRFGRPVPRQPAHSLHWGWILCLLTGFLPLSATASKFTVNRHRVSPEFIGSRNCVRMAFTAESPLGQGQ